MILQKKYTCSCADELRTTTSVITLIHPVDVVRGDGRQEGSKLRETTDNTANNRKI